MSLEMEYKELLDKKQIPEHVAIIMDGNGRWAKGQGKERSYGHQAGVGSVRVIAETAARLGLRYLTLYTFSTENWNRPAGEIAVLMKLLLDSLEEEIFMKNNIRFDVIGELDKLPPEVRELMEESIAHTGKNTGMTLVLALSYSSRWEITDSVKRIAKAVREQTLQLADIHECTISSFLTTASMPDPDLLIRTGGEIRLSNFLLWQCAYSELYFCDTYWPDFKEEEFYRAIYDYQQRERRFGKTSKQI